MVQGPGGNSPMMNAYQHNPNINKNFASQIEGQAQQLQNAMKQGGNKEAIAGQAKNWVKDQVKSLIEKGDTKGVEDFVKTLQNVAATSMTMKGIFQAMLQGPPEMLGGSDEDEGWFKTSGSKGIAGMFADGFTTAGPKGLMLQDLKATVTQAAAEAKPSASVLSGLMGKLKG